MCTAVWLDPKWEQMTLEEREVYVARWNERMREFSEDLEVGRQVRADKREGE